MDQKFLEQIQAGTYIWIGNAYNAHKWAVVVERVTPTLIVAADARYDRKHGYEKGISISGARITGIATPTEVTEYQYAQARKETERKAKDAAARAYDAKKAELSNLFADERTWVHASDLATGYERFQLSIDGLTEQEVRAFAKHIAKFRKE